MSSKSRLQASKSEADYDPVSSTHTERSVHVNDSDGSHQDTKNIETSEYTPVRPLNENRSKQPDRIRNELEERQTFTDL